MDDDGQHLVLNGSDVEDNEMNNFIEHFDVEGESDEDESGSEEGDSNSPPPSLRSSSGTEAEDEQAPRQQKSKAAGAGAGPSGAKPSAAKSTAPAASTAKARGNARQAAAKPSAKDGPGREPIIWIQFAKYRAGLTSMARLGIVELKQWEAFEKEGQIPPGFLSWYADQIKGPRSVPHVVTVSNLPSGFPEFCHWIAGGHYKPSGKGGTLMYGFHAMADNCVKRVKAAVAGGGRPKVPVASTTRATAAAAPAAEPTSGAAGAAAGAASQNGVNGNIDPKSRKRERRMMRKGFLGAANGLGFAEKMQSALAELESIDEKEDETKNNDNNKGKDGGNRGKAAANRANLMGMRAEEEFRRKIRDYGEPMDEFIDDDILGFAWRSSEVPVATRTMLCGLRRAGLYRRRADRQFETLEEELENSISRMVRIEAQYHALLAETTGREYSIETVTSRALPMVREATGLVEAGHPEQALDIFGNAIKLLEMHVERWCGHKSTPTMERARDVMACALCNRSVANCMVGNTYYGKEDAMRATEMWYGDEAATLLEQSSALLNKQGPSPAAEWKLLPVPPP